MPLLPLVELPLELGGGVVVVLSEEDPDDPVPVLPDEPDEEPPIEPLDPLEPVDVSEPDLSELPVPIEPVDPELPVPIEPVDPELPEEEPFGMISICGTFEPVKLART